MDRRVGLGREEGAELDVWGNRVRERNGGKVGWMGVWGERERKGQGWMDA